MVIFIALLIDAAFGYADPLVQAIGHPVTWFGHLLTWLDESLNKDSLEPQKKRMRGMAALAVLLAVAILPALLIQILLSNVPLGGLILAVLASPLLAQRSLYEHVGRVAESLEDDGILAARAAVGMIVGRDTDALDEADIARAAIESLAESFSDGVVAPAFWIAVFGLPGGTGYKAANTADSMIGHRTPRYLDFGWAAARFDDLINLPASRLSALLLVAAAACVPGVSAGGAWRAVWRDAGRHDSPNAGWPEAAVAGALGIALGGPRRYGNEAVDHGWIGEGGRRDLEAQDVRAALRLYLVADAMLIFLALLVGVARLIAP